MIHFDNGIQHECASNTLAVEATNAFLPPYESPPPDWHETAAAAKDKDPDSQDSELMPGIAPEQDEEEGGPEADEARGGEEEGGGKEEEGGEGGGTHEEVVQAVSYPQHLIAAGERIACFCWGQRW